MAIQLLPQALEGVKVFCPLMEHCWEFSADAQEKGFFILPMISIRLLYIQNDYSRSQPEAV